MTKTFPYGFDPAARLPDGAEKTLQHLFRARHTYCEHPNLYHYFVREDLQELLARCDRETRIAGDVRYYMLLAHVNTQDIAGCRELLNYWWDWSRGARPGPVVVNISKFTPGEHYHVRDEKFNTMAEARAYIKQQGWEFGQFLEEHVYATSGD